MKLFITNKDVFDNDFNSVESQKKIHKTAFNNLLNEIGVNATPPKTIKLDFDLFCIEFTYISNSSDVYFYSYERW